MFCISISHKNSGIEIRKKFAFPESVQKKISYELIKSKEVSECVVLCTCNRTEIYFCGNENSERNVKIKLSEYSGISVNDFAQYIRVYHYDSAIRHLFRVSCGIESMVIGEDEILGQVKNSYKKALENKTVFHNLNIIFQSAISCAKKIKTDTEISRTSISTATLAANEASQLGENINVMLIGATGKIGSVVLKNLLSHKNINVLFTVRENSINPELYSDFTATAIKYNERYKYIEKCDCIISATSSPHYTITLNKIKDFISDGRKRLFIDLAVPPDIDESIGEYSNIRLIGIDYFEKLAKNNNILKLDSVEAAENIILEDMKDLKKSLAFHEFFPELEKVKEKFSGISFEKIIYNMKSDLSPECFIEVLDFFRNYSGG